MLLLPVLEKEKNKNGGADGLLLSQRKREKPSVERKKCSGEDSGQVGGDGSSG